jgi:hypothetical protein
MGVAIWERNTLRRPAEQEERGEDVIEESDDGLGDQILMLASLKSDIITEFLTSLKIAAAM